MPPRKKKEQAAPESAGLGPAEVGSGKPPAPVRSLAEAVESDGGAALATYRDPFGGHWVVFASLPIALVEATPFQRELSEAHANRLAAVIPKVGRFLDPLIAVRRGDGYWTPNGMHRLEAMRRLGARAVTALLVPEEEIAYRILALNTEKAHNLKDKALEVVRMADALAADSETGRLSELAFEFEFEEPAYLTLGRCYERKARFAGSAYMPVARRCEAFLDRPLAETIPVRAERAELLLELDVAVDRCVAALKEAGLQSAYLKPFVVARLSPLRPARGRRAAGEAPDFDEVLKKMLARAERFDADKIRPQDLAAGAVSSGD